MPTKYINKRKIQVDTRNFACTIGSEKQKVGNRGCSWKNQTGTRKPTPLLQATPTACLPEGVLPFGHHGPVARGPPAGDCCSTQPSYLSQRLANLCLLTDFRPRVFVRVLTHISRFPPAISYSVISNYSVFSHFPLLPFLFSLM